MKTVLVASLCLLLAACNSQNSGGSDVKLASKKDTISYTIGMNIGENLKKQGIDADANVIAQGLKDAFTGAKVQLTAEQGEAAMNTLQSDMMAKRDEEAKGAAEKNKTFLEENKKKEGVVTTETGLQYKILKTGEGKKPKIGDVVTVNYIGKLIDGTEFDSSVKRGQPAEFRLGDVIPGWNEALAMMPVGSKWEVYIPSDLAYGERGIPNGPIGPNATLIFEVELLSIK